MNPSDPLRAAENALWHALEERRDQIRAAGLGFSERQHHRFRELWEEKRLIQGLNESMARYKEGSGDPYYLRPMAEALKHGFQPWEELLLRHDEAWSPYVSAKARLGCQRSIADAKAFIPFL